MLFSLQSRFLPQQMQGSFWQGDLGMGMEALARTHGFGEEFKRLRAMDPLPHLDQENLGIWGKYPTAASLSRCSFI